MMTRYPTYYPQFQCLGGACPDTCCRDWDIVLDEDTLDSYQTAPSPLREHIAANLVTDEDGDICFRLRPDGFCALLTSDGLCPIQRDWGAEHLCEHCGAYPRFTEEYGHLTETALAISCPLAAQLLMDTSVFALTEQDDGQPDTPFPSLPPQLMSQLEESRAHVFSWLTRWDVPFWERLQGVTRYSWEVQAQLGTAPCPVPTVSPHSVPPEVLTPLGLELLKLFGALEPLRPQWYHTLGQARETLSALSLEQLAALRHRLDVVYPQWDTHLTHLACYLVFRHWLKAVNDDQLYGRGQLVAASCILLYHLYLAHLSIHSTLSHTEVQALWSGFSREVEHLEDNLEGLIDAFSHTPTPLLWLEPSLGGML